MIPHCLIYICILIYASTTLTYLSIGCRLRICIQHTEYRIYGNLASCRAPDQVATSNQFVSHWFDLARVRTQTQGFKSYDHTRMEGGRSTHSAIAPDVVATPCGKLLVLLMHHIRSVPLPACTAWKAPTMHCAAPGRSAAIRVHDGEQRDS